MDETFALATRRVIRFSIGYLVAVLMAAGLNLAGVTALRSGAVDPLSPGTRAWYLLGSLAIGLVMTVCVIGLLVSAVVWIISAHQVTPSGPGAVGYGGLALAVLLAAAGVLFGSALLQIAGWIALLAGVFLARARIRRLTGRPDLGGRRLPTVTSDDWDASIWDPEVVQDIERRGRPTP